MSLFVDDEHLVPDETARPSKLDKLMCDCAIGLHTVFVTLVDLHSHIMQLVYEVYK